MMSQKDELLEDSESQTPESIEGAESNPEEELQSLRAAIAIKDKAIDEFKKRITEYETKIVEVRDYVKRMEQEISAIRDRAKRDLDRNVHLKTIEFLRPFLSLVDNFDRSLANVSGDSAFVEGMKLIKKELDEILKAAGLKRMNAVGERFDPQLHEAIGSEPVSAEKDGLVTKELRSGFMLGDAVVRAAQVLVGAA